MFQNRVLQRMCGPKRKGVMGGWEKLPNEELRNLSSSPNISRVIKSENTTTRVTVHRHEMRNGTKFKSETIRKDPTWKDNIKMDVN